ncbi:MAG: hypothetical protein J2P36_01360 [Ktedonobacteraceae bacterium]|nr:hypothetical protein [Ktedonobacteraceae bacterium]
MEQFINYYAPKEHIREITGGREQVTEHDLVLYARNHDLATSDKEAEQWIGKKQQFLIDDDAATLLRKHQENLAASDLVTLVSTKFPDADVPNCHVGMNWSYGFIAAKDAQQMFRLNEKGQDLLSNRDLFLTVADVEQMLRQSQWKGQKSPENNETLKGLRLFGTRDWLGGTSGIEQLQLAAAFGAPARIIGNLVSEGVVQSEIVSLDAHGHGSYQPGNITLETLMEQVKHGPVGLHVRDTPLAPPAQPGRTNHMITVYGIEENKGEREYSINDSGEYARVGDFYVKGGSYPVVAAVGIDRRVSEQAIIQSWQQSWNDIRLEDGKKIRIANGLLVPQPGDERKKSVKKSYTEGH